MNIQLEKFNITYWEQFKNLISNYWREGHPLTEKSLFNWQYTGFGSLSNGYLSRVLLNEDEMVGFLGITPGLYQFRYKGNFNIVPGAVSTLAIIKPEYRTGLEFYKLNKDLIHEFKVVETLGANRKLTVPINLRFKYSYLEQLNRYILPLEEEGYLALLEQKPAPDVITDWIKTIRVASKTEPIPFDAPRFEQLWIKSTENVDLFSLYRNADFWNWRYRDSKGFSYQCFGDPDKSGLVVARVEPVLTSPGNKPTRMKVLRIIEVIPAVGEVWQGTEDQNLIELLGGVLAWGLDQGCCAADFQCSTDRLGASLLGSGFRLQPEGRSVPELSLAVLFQPLSHSKSAINAMWRISHKGELVDYNPRDTYIVKSNGDMDRPNVQF